MNSSSTGVVVLSMDDGGLKDYRRIRVDKVRDGGWDDVRFMVAVPRLGGGGRAWSTLENSGGQDLALAAGQVLGMGKEKEVRLLGVPGFPGGPCRSGGVMPGRGGLKPERPVGGATGTVSEPVPVTEVYGELLADAADGAAASGKGKPRSGEALLHSATAGRSVLRWHDGRCSGWDERAGL